MMSTHWSNHFYKFSKTNWWCCSIWMFYLNPIFSWFWSFFFHNNCWTMHWQQIRRANDVTQISQKWCRKKFICQKSCFVFKKCHQFFVNVGLFIFNQREHFRQFIKNITFDFDLFDQTSQFFFIRDICINHFMKFQNFCFVYIFLFVIVYIKINFSIFFILWINKYLTQFFHFFNHLSAFIAWTKIESIMQSFSQHHFFHHPQQPFF